ncbi:MAG: DUF6320 domain-containing protein [Oscillospiraceae bacterium]
MKYCKSCQVYIKGKHERCVLCGNMLSDADTAEDQDEVFPTVPPCYERRLAARIMIFISLSAIVASFAIRMLFPTTVNWPIFVLFGIASAWLSLFEILRKGHNIPRIILWQSIILPLLAIFWDWETGWRGWSLDYLIPILYVAAEVVMYVTAKMMKLSSKDYISYAFLDALFGIIPALFILFNWISTPYASIICVAVSIIFLLALIIFQGGNVKKEFDKRMHI